MPKSNPAVPDSDELDLELSAEDEDYELDDDFADDLDDEDIEYEDDYEDDEDVTPRRRPHRPPSEDLASQLEAATAERDSLKSRIGDVVRKAGERNKEYREEVEAWAENTQEYYTSQIELARQGAYEEGRRSVEKDLLPLLASEEKAEYLEAVHSTPQNVSHREVKQVNFKTSNSDTAVSAVVDQFQNLGVPLDQLDRTSVETVVESGTRFLTAQFSNLKTKVDDLETKVERKTRDESGATRVSGGGGGSASSAPTPARSLQRQIDEIDAKIASAKKRHAIDQYVQLKQQRDKIEARIRATARNRR